MRNSALRQIDLDLLRAFLVVMSERSVSRAADALGMTQSGLSRALARMRKVFRDDLLVRSGAAMVATPRGLELTQAVRDVLALLEQRVLPVAGFEPARAQREFLTAMSDISEVYALPPMLAALRRDAPGCTLRNRHVRNTDLMQALEVGEVELAFGNVSGPASSMYQQTLFHSGFVVLAAAGHPRLRGRLSRQQYESESHVVVPSGADDHLHNSGLSPLGVRRRIALVAGGTMSLPWMLCGTELLATVPSVVGELVRGRLPLKAHPLPFAVPPLSINTYWHPRSHTDPGHRWLRELIFEVLHAPPAPAVADTPE
ncbi:LysR family transcriptional regulator [Aquabacterium sp. J223]|uniref:LysR family transcriptional regulator n=1 Tax=Aquabacterium sp. J223 TaxID=2898431 RepID=UPI0021ADCBDA|nr:LysR family transcriptional regulator [Aquabacterium sp. J223]UUX97556.1 LysR family transcriptional regulator [Aquabacterium sp. J223]